MYRFVLYISLTYIVSLILFSGYASTTHKSPVKYGKYKKKEKNLDKVEYDPDAAAVMLCKYGEIEYRNRLIHITKHIRIKILKEEGIKHADIQIPYYSKDGFENITRVKAQTVNFDDGKEQITEVDKDNIYDIDIHHNFNEVRFTFPAVEAGSIIEYKYTLASESYLTLDEWNFQSEIPVLHSEIFVGMPDWLDYRIVFSGFKMIEKYKDETTNNWVLNDLRALKDVPYLYNIEDYAEKIKFQLSGYRKRAYNGVSSYEQVLKTWDQFAEEKLNTYEYRNYLNRSGLARDILEQIDLQGKSREEKIEIIFDYVRTNYHWNNKYRRVPELKIQELQETGEGNSAAINLLLTVLLNEADIDANPALVSTRSYGRVTKNYPLLTQFSHVLCCIHHNERDYQLLDATHPFASPNYLPEEILNEEAFVMSRKNPQWVKIDPYDNNTETIMVRTNFTTESTADIALSFMFDGNNALQARTEIYKNNAEGWIYDKLTIAEDEKLGECHISNLDSTLHTLKVEKRIKSSFNIAGEMLYLNPYFFTALKENPLHEPERYYPVEFPYPYNLRYYNYIVLPKGYVVAEKPESERIKLPNDYGEFRYFMEQTRDHLNLSIYFELNKMIIPAGNYGVLREFYDIVAAKLNQQIVLKKASTDTSSSKN